MRAFMLAAVFVGSSFIQCAMAASAGDALKTFGLVGAWSQNCAQNPEEPSSRSEAGREPARWIYSTSLLANPMLTMMRRLEQGLNVVHHEIVSAEQVTNDKIKYKEVLISHKLGDNPEQKFSNAMPVTTVIQQSNDKIAVFSQLSDDGTSFVENGLFIVTTPDHGQMKEVNRIPTDTLERCLN